MRKKINKRIICQWCQITFIKLVRVDSLVKYCSVKCRGFGKSNAVKIYYAARPNLRKEISKKSSLTKRNRIKDDPKYAYRIVENISGRSDDWFVYEDDIRIHPIVFRHILGQEPAISEYQVEQTKSNSKGKWLVIPFGMKSEEAVNATRGQVSKIDPRVKKIYMAVGSGVSLSGILWGLQDQGWKGKVIGVVIGSDPEGTLDEYAPENWRNMVRLVESGVDYHKKINAQIGHIKLDPIYEAKVLQFIKGNSDEMLWIIGERQ